MRERTRDGAGFTLVHGDVNPGNVLTPISGAGPVYLIDRQPFDWSLTTWLGASDIAYMIVHRWDTELRRELELPVLRHYHAALERRGVVGLQLGAAAARLPAFGGAEHLCGHRVVRDRGRSHQDALALGGAAAQGYGGVLRPGVRLGR